MSSPGSKGPAPCSPSRKGQVIALDEELCTGCALCEELATDNIEVPLRTDVAVVTKQPSTAAEWDDCLEAVKHCPAGGLTVEDDE